ncbi:MAG: hypothetical protein J6125_01290 [Clostridia bacterium]|nr:hypothetical protein [Clostridia bacterium]
MMTTKKCLAIALVILLGCSSLFSCEKKNKRGATDPATTAGPASDAPTEPGSQLVTVTPDPATDPAELTMLQKLSASVYAAAIEERITVSRSGVEISSLSRTYDVAAGTWTETRRVRNSSDSDSIWSVTTADGTFSGALAAAELTESDFSAPDDESDDAYRRPLTAAAVARLLEDDAPSGDVVVTIEAVGNAVSVLSFDYVTESGDDVSIRFSFAY